MDDSFEMPVGQLMAGKRGLVMGVANRNSIAWGSTLVNWESDSCLEVPDEFLLCSLDAPRARSTAPKTSAMPRLREYVSQLVTSVFG